LRTVAQIQTIRYLHDVEGWSIRRIARELHVSPKTIRRSLDRSVSTEEPRYTRTAPIFSPKMGPYGGVIDAWLEADLSAPKKQRHTARRIWERLREEYGAEVAESTVRAFVARRRREVAPKGDAFLHLVFPPAEAAQVDWGEACVVMAGVPTRIYLFCMRLCYSTAAFVMAFPNARRECFLEGHVRAFEFFGGVPRRIVYDNLSSAVKRILHGRRRELNDRFLTLAAHYLFEPVFANPGAGWEKGLVEDLVGTFRRNVLVPVPTADSFAELNNRLWEELLGWRRKAPPNRGGHTVGELWDEERRLFLPLPAAAYRASTSHSVRVSKFATVQYERVTYSVPAQYAGRTLRLEAFYDHLEVYDGGRLVARHELAKKGSTPVLVLDHYLDVLIRKPAAVRHARVVVELGQVVTSYRDAFLRARPEAHRDFVRILLLSRRYTLPAVERAIAKAHTDRIYDADRVAALLEAELGKAQDSSMPPVAGPKVEQTPPEAYDELLTGAPV
jgi:transposase